MGTVFDDHFQVILTSDSCLNLYPNNSLSQFTNWLPEPLNFGTDFEKWGVALKAIYFPPATKPTTTSSTANSTSGEINSNIFIYTNIISGQYLGGSSARVLSCLPPAYEKSYHQFENVCFIPLARRDIQEISISLRDKFFNKYPFPASHINTIVVLLFKRHS